MQEKSWIYHQSCSPTNDLYYTIKVFHLSSTGQNKHLAPNGCLDAQGVFVGLPPHAAAVAPGQTAALLGAG